MKLASRIGKDAGLYSIEPVFAKLIGIFLIPLYTAYLSTADYGVVNFIIAIGSFCLPFITMGMDAIFWMHYKGDSKEKGKVVFTTTAISSATSLIVITIAFIYMFVKWDSQSFLVVGYVCSLCMQVLYQRGQNFLRAQRKITIFLLSSGIYTLLRIIIAIVLIVYVNMHIRGVIYSIIATNIMLGISGYLYIKQHWAINHNMTEYKEYLVLGWPIMLGNVSALMMNLADKFSINYLSTKSELGLYSFAFNFAVPFSAFAFAPFMKAWVPIRWELFRGDTAHDSFRKVAGALTTLLPAAALVYSTMAIVFARLLSRDESYNVALYLVPILAMSKVFYGLYWYDLMGFLFAKKTKYLPLLTTGMGIVNIIGNILLVTRYGAYGAALATLGSFIVIRYIAYYYSHKVYRYDRKMGRETVVVIIALVLAFIVSSQSHLNACYLIGIGIFFGTAVVGLGLITRVIEWRYFRDIVRVMRGRIQRSSK